MSVDQEEWLQQFVLPLIAGGDVRVSAALGSVELELLLAERPAGEAQRRIAAARQAVVAELLIDAPPPPLDEPALRIAVAVSNLLFLAHPAAQAALVRRSRLQKLTSFTERAVSLPPPASARELAERHSLLHHLFDLGRDDVRVSYWAGRREYRGEEPPARLLMWPRVRRVREERWRVGVVTQAIADPLERPIVLALLRASPLTDLLEPMRLDPAFELAPLARWLRHPQIARAVADRYLSVGLEPIGPAYAAALLTLYTQRERQAEAQVATAFLAHLHLLMLLSDGRGPAGEAHPALGRWPLVTQGQDAMRDFFGLFAVAQRFGLGRPDDVARDPRLAEAVERHAQACRVACGEARLRELDALMARGVAAQGLGGILTQNEGS